MVEFFLTREEHGRVDDGRTQKTSSNIILKINVVFDNCSFSYIIQ